MFGFFESKEVTVIDKTDKAQERFKVYEQTLIATTSDLRDKRSKLNKLLDNDMNNFLNDLNNHHG